MPWQGPWQLGLKRELPYCMTILVELSCIPCLLLLRLVIGHVVCAGSGKTHTMSGHEDVISDDLYQGDGRDGIISRAVQYLFHQVKSATWQLA